MTDAQTGGGDRRKKDDLTSGDVAVERSACSCPSACSLRVGVSVLFGRLAYRASLDRYSSLESDHREESNPFDFVYLGYEPERYLRGLLNYYRTSGELIPLVIQSGYFHGRYSPQESNNHLYPYEKVAIELVERSDEGNRISYRLFVWRLKIAGLFRKIVSRLNQRLYQTLYVPKAPREIPSIPLPLHTEVKYADSGSTPHSEKTRSGSSHQTTGEQSRHKLATTNLHDQTGVDLGDRILGGVGSSLFRENVQGESPATGGERRSRQRFSNFP